MSENGEVFLLSICCLTIEKRSEKWEVLKAEIERQIEGQPVEFLWHLDRDKTPIGVNRQKQLEAARGKYVVWIDDDDFIDPKYVKNVLKAAENDTDCIGYLIACDISSNGKQEKSTAIVSMRYKDWHENKDGYRYAQAIYQKTPVKREIALKAGFTPKRFGEDYDYCMGIQPYLESETFIDWPMYHYRYTPETNRHGIEDNKTR